MGPDLPFSLLQSPVRIVPKSTDVSKTDEDQKPAVEPQIGRRSRNDPWFKTARKIIDSGDALQR